MVDLISKGALRSFVRSLRQCLEGKHSPLSLVTRRDEQRNAT